MDEKNKDTTHEMLRTGLRQAIKAFAVLSGVGIYLVVFVGFPGAFYTLFRQLKQNGIV